MSLLLLNILTILKDFVSIIPFGTYFSFCLSYTAWPSYFEETHEDTNITHNAPPSARSNVDDALLALLNWLLQTIKDWLYREWRNCFWDDEWEYLILFRDIINRLRGRLPRLSYRIKMWWHHFMFNVLLDHGYYSQALTIANARCIREENRIMVLQRLFATTVPGTDRYAWLKREHVKVKAALELWTARCMYLYEIKWYMNMLHEQLELLKQPTNGKAWSLSPSLFSADTRYYHRLNYYIKRLNVDMYNILTQDTVTWSEDTFKWLKDAIVIPASVDPVFLAQAQDSRDAELYMYQHYLKLLAHSTDPTLQRYCLYIRRLDALHRRCMGTVYRIRRRLFLAQIVDSQAAALGAVTALTTRSGQYGHLRQLTALHQACKELEDALCQLELYRYMYRRTYTNYLTGVDTRRERAVSDRMMSSLLRKTVRFVGGLDKAEGPQELDKRFDAYVETLRKREKHVRHLVDPPTMTMQVETISVHDEYVEAFEAVPL